MRIASNRAKATARASLEPAAGPAVAAAGGTEATVGVTGAAGAGVRGTADGRGVGAFAGFTGFAAVVPAAVVGPGAAAGEAAEGVASNGPSKVFCCSAVSRPRTAARVANPTRCLRVCASGGLAASISFTRPAASVSSGSICAFWRSSGLTKASNSNCASAGLLPANNWASPIVLSTRRENAAARSPSRASASCPSLPRMPSTAFRAAVLRKDPAAYWAETASTSPRARATRPLSSCRSCSGSGASSAAYRTASNRNSAAVAHPAKTWPTGKVVGSGAGNGAGSAFGDVAGRVAGRGAAAPRVAGAGGGAAAAAAGVAGAAGRVAGAGGTAGGRGGAGAVAAEEGAASRRSAAPGRPSAAVAANKMTPGL